MYTIFRVWESGEKKLTIVKFVHNVSTLGGRDEKGQDLRVILSYRYLASLGYMRSCLQRNSACPLMSHKR